MPDEEGNGTSLERLWSREIRHLHRQFSTRLRSSSALAGGESAAEEGRSSGKAWFLGGGYFTPLACCACPEAGQIGVGDIRPPSPSSPGGGRDWETWTGKEEWEPKVLLDSGQAGEAPPEDWVRVGDRGKEKWPASEKAFEGEQESQQAEAQVAEVEADAIPGEDKQAHHGAAQHGDAEFVELWPGLGRLMPENLDFWELTRGRPPRRIPSVEHRGVTPRQLRTLLAFLKKRCSESGVIRGWYDPRTGELLHYKTFNFFHLHHWIIKPLTQRLQCSFAEAVSSDIHPVHTVSSPSSHPGTPLKGSPSTRVKWFVGHWWGEKLLDFTKRIMKHAGENEESYWVCPLCTNLYECSGLAVADVRDKSGIVGLHALTSLKVYLSGCTGLNAIEELERGLPAFQSLSMLELNVSYCWELTDVEELGKSLAKLRFLRDLRINFSDCSGLKSIASLGRGFASLPALSCLELNLSGCTGLETVDDFGGSLGRLEALDTLRLDFSGCSRLKEVGGLNRGFRSLRQLTTLVLNFSGCIGLATVDELGRGLVMLASLTTLEVNFFGCSSLASVDDLGRGLALVRSLTILKLELFGCSSLSKIDELQRGIAALRERKELGQLEVNIAGCQALANMPPSR